MEHDALCEHFVRVVQELSLTRTLDEIMRVVRQEARRLTGADGATFVLREGELCYYAEEDAIAPLWKGRRFPMKSCISGWVMLNKKTAVINDIYADGRIPADAYRPTFVKSLVMVPIRTMEPIGAIGNYWARCRQPSAREVKLLQALADTTSVALENVQVYHEMEKRVHDRTAELRRMVEQLTRGATEGNTRHGLIPMCFHCKSIRGEDGHWHNLESYLVKHANLMLTHGICPSCHFKLFSDIDD